MVLEVTASTSLGTTNGKGMGCIRGREVHHMESQNLDVMIDDGGARHEGLGLGREVRES